MKVAHGCHDCPQICHVPEHSICCVETSNDTVLWVISRALPPEGLCAAQGMSHIMSERPITMVLRRVLHPRSAIRASAKVLMPSVSSYGKMIPRLLCKSSRAWWVGVDTMGNPCAIAISSVPCSTQNTLTH